MSFFHCLYGLADSNAYSMLAQSHDVIYKLAAALKISSVTAL